MARKISKGKCAFCEQIVAKNAITKHLAACEKRLAQLNQPPAGKAKLRQVALIHLLVEGRDLPQYWMHIEIPGDPLLWYLDDFLRGIWLECCGHLSAFTIGDQRYSVMPEPGYGERGMAVKVGSLFRPTVVALHEYDFGSTTELTLKYVGQREASYRGFEVNILARNEAPELVCDICGAPATQICTQCVWEDKGLLCEQHTVDHECGEEMLLPVVNSPRVGVCGYTG